MSPVYSCGPKSAIHKGGVCPRRKLMSTGLGLGKQLGSRIRAHNWEHLVTQCGEISSGDEAHRWDSGVRIAQRAGGEQLGVGEPCGRCGEAQVERSPG